MKRKIRFLIVILSAFIISSCSCKNKSNNFTKIAEENHIVNYFGVDEQGKLIAVDTNGNQIQPCIQPNTNINSGKTNSGSEPCRTQIIERDGRTIVIKNGRQIPALYDEEIRVTGFKGSHCQTTSGGGRQIERCR